MSAKSGFQKMLKAKRLRAMTVSLAKKMEVYRQGLERNRWEDLEACVCAAAISMIEAEEGLTEAINLMNSSRRRAKNR